jgi:signal transduction histidine kinase
LVGFATTQRVTEESLHITDINVERLLTTSLKILYPKIKAKSITYQLEFPNEPVIIRGDQRILSEVFYHLLENAVKFNKPKGEIKIRAQHLPSTVEAEETVIEIEDTGIGIPRTELDKIFDKFYQVEEHLVRAVGGLA